MSCSPDHGPSLPGAVDVGIVVITYNSAEHVDALVRSLPAAAEGVTVHVVAVDNASSDGTVAALAERDIETIASEENIGYAAGINRGLEQLAHARSVLVLNPDVVLGRGSLRRMLDALADDRVGIVVPQMRDPSGALAFSQRRDPSIGRALGIALLGDRIAHRFAVLSESVAVQSAYMSAGDVDWAVGAVMLISRRCLDRIGPWDESFFLYSEETEYCMRARAHGFVVRYEPSAVAVHEGGGGVHNPRLRSMMVVNRVRLYARSHGPVTSWIYFGAVTLNEAIRSLVGNVPARAALVSLLRPKHRPPEIRCSASLLPR